MKKWEARPQKRHKRRQYDENVVKAFLLLKTKNPYKQELRKAIRNRVASYTISIIKASSGLMHKVSETYRDITDSRTVEVPGEFFSEAFIKHLLRGTGETSRRNERVYALQENYIV